MSKFEKVNFTSDDQFGYPKHDIDPRLKDDEWLVQYAKAAWWDNSYAMPHAAFFNAFGSYEKLRLYAIGKQPVNEYKKQMGVEGPDDETPMVINWTAPPWISKHRSSAIDRVVQKKFEVSCTPIDATAKAELTKIYSQLRAKMAVREMMKQQNPELANHPLLMPGSNEPLDEEELNMRIDFGEQFNRAKDAEEVISLAFYKNGIEDMERKWDEDLFDTGVAGYYEGLDDNAEPDARAVDVERMVISRSRYKDFRDIRHAGEVIDMSLIDLAVKTKKDGSPAFTDEEIQFLRQDIAGQTNWASNGQRMSTMFKQQDPGKVKVLQLYLFSYDEKVYRNSTDKIGNKVFVDHEDNYGRGRGAAKDKYMRKRIKNVYRVSWIVGTNLCYDCGLVPNRKTSTDPKRIAETELPYRLVACNFYEMLVQGYIERAIPFIDEACLTWYRIQNFKARMVPAGWFIDLDAIESVALNKGGQDMTPKQLLNFFFQSGVLAGRLKDVMGDNQNYKGPVIPIANSVASELQGLYQDLLFNLGQIEQICGGNQITSGNPNPKTLSPGYEIANDSNDSALAEITTARNYLINKLAGDMYMRAQQSIKINGGYEGYSRALNTNTLQFIKASDSVPLKDVGIIVRETMTDQERQFLVQECQQDRLNGFLDASDMMVIMNTYNFKQAQQMIAYKIKTNKQQQEQSKQQLAQQQIQGNQQTAQQTAQMQMQLEKMREDAKNAQIENGKRWDMMIEQMKLQQKDSQSQRDNQTKLIQHMTPAAETPQPMA